MVVQHHLLQIRYNIACGLKPDHQVWAKEGREYRAHPDKDSPEPTAGFGLRRDGPRSEQPFRLATD